MASRQRALDASSDRAVELLRTIGRELRQARIARGLSQSFVASVVGIAQSQLSQIERGRHHAVSVPVLARLGTAVGLELGIRLFPAGEPIRDKAHAALLERFRQAVGIGWEWAAEVPLPIPGDRRRWDRLLRRQALVIGVEGETRPTDMQELQGRVALKKRDGNVDRVVLVLADTAWCRRLLRLNDMEATFPVPGRVALRALAEGRDPGGDAVILV